jgi:hypothetical protein
LHNLLTYEQFLNEQYLPYFGVKQALDDSVNFSQNANDFTRFYSMSPTWWNLWNTANKDKFEIVHDAFTKTYTVRSEGNVVFVYDYGRSKVFTNEKPDLFDLRSTPPKELEKAKNIDVEDPTKKPKEEKKEDKPKIEEDVTTDPNRTVGTGTYTSTTSHGSFLSRGYSNTTDSSSAGSIPVYTN